MARRHAPAYTISINAPPTRRTGPADRLLQRELLLAGAGACAAWDVVEIMRKRAPGRTGLTVEVVGEQAPEPPWAYERSTLHFTCRGRGISREP